MEPTCQCCVSSPSPVSLSVNLLIILHKIGDICLCLLNVKRQHPCPCVLPVSAVLPVMLAATMSNISARYLLGTVGKLIFFESKKTR